MALIDTDEAVGHFRRVIEATESNGAYNEGFIDAVEFCISHLSTMPSAKPERKRGKWIRKPNIYGVAYCSECDYELHTNNTNFCPNCGADMRDNKKEWGC